MCLIDYRIYLSAIALALTVLSTGAIADSSSVEDFTSIINTGAVKQTTSGSGNQQDLNVGSATSTRANSFSANVTTEAITQSSSGTGIVQSANIGSANNAKVDSFTATVTTGKIEQISNRSGDRQELDIGSVNNSTVNGAFKVNVKVKDGVRQTGSGEIVLGSVKNSNMQNFSTTLDVKGKVTGNNIRIGSIVGGERFDKQGQSNGMGQDPNNSVNNGLVMPTIFNNSPPGTSNNNSNMTSTLEGVGKFGLGALGVYYGVGTIVTGCTTIVGCPVSIVVGGGIAIIGGGLSVASGVGDIVGKETPPVIDEVSSFIDGIGPTIP